MNTEKILLDALLEILHVISHDGAYEDTEMVIESLIDAGISQDTINYYIKL